MKKRFLLILGVVASLSLTGCFEQEKTLKCSAHFSNENEDVELTAVFEKNYLKKINIKTFASFNDVEYANAYYEMYKEDSEQKVSIDGKNVIFEKEENIDSKDDIYSYKKYRDSLIGQGYSCEK